MKMIQQFRSAFKRRAARKQWEKRNVQYYDHYMMYGSILGGFSSLMKFGGK